MVEYDREIYYDYANSIFRDMQTFLFNIEKYRMIIHVLPVNFENVLIATAIF